jgi:hypothetical protein
LDRFQFVGRAGEHDFDLRNDERGWLVPTISEGTARLDAVKKAVSNLAFKRRSSL